MGIRISDMTLSGALIPGDEVPFIGTETGKEENYRYDLGADLAGRPTNETLEAYSTNEVLAEPSGAALIGANDGASGSIFTSVQGFIAKLLSSTGSSIVGFLQAGTGAVPRTMQDKAREILSAFDFGYGLPGNTPAQNTTALIKAIDAQQEVIGGALHIPFTTNSLVEPISYTLTVGQPLIMFGDGQSSTVLRKAGNSTDPVLTLNSTGHLQPYHNISAMRFDNGLRPTRAGIGVKLVDIPRFVFDRVMFEGCDTGVRAEGALIGTFSECSALNCNIGYDITKSSAGIHPNLLNFVRGEASGNKLAMRFDSGTMLNVERVDFEGNGIAGDTTTGVIHFGNTLPEEAGYAQVYISGWFEANLGTTILGVNPSPAGKQSIVCISDSLFINNEDVEVNLTGWTSIQLQRVVAPTGTWTTQADDFDADISTIIKTINDTSTNGPVNLRTSTARYYNSMSSARIRARAFSLNAQDLLMATDDQLTGGATKDIGLFKDGDGIAYLGGPSGRKLQWNQTGVGFNGSAPIAKGAAIANPTDAATTQAALISLLTYARSLGLIAP